MTDKYYEDLNVPDDFLLQELEAYHTELASDQFEAASELLSEIRDRLKERGRRLEDPAELSLLRNLLCTRGKMIKG